MKIALIAAMAKNRVIGLHNELPWHLSADLKRFREITMGKAILMGRKTHKSIGRPLPGRTNVVISRNKSYAPKGCLVFNSLESAFSHLQQHPLIMVIGGASLYQATFPMAEILYLTLIHRDFDGDTFFPEIDLTAWNVKEKQDFYAKPEMPFDYSFITFHKTAL